MPFDLPEALLELMFIILLIVIILIIFSASIKIVKEYERAVIFRLGRLLGAKGPGLFFIIPIFDKFFKVDLRVLVADVPKQRIVTKDNVSVDVDAVIYYRVFDPVKAVTTVTDYNYACQLLAQTTLRDVLGQVELDELLTKREELNKRLQVLLDVVTDPWGIKVTAVTIKDVALPEAMLRAMAKQAEAEREKRSRVIMAEGELQASKIMAEAAKQYEEHAMAMRLRELQTLTEIARERNLIVVTSQTFTTPGEIAAFTKAFHNKEREKEEKQTM
ncbi:MAG: slipin family protein [Thermoprotei archaeon]